MGGREDREKATPVSRRHEAAIAALIFFAAVTVRLIYYSHLKSNSPVFDLLINDSQLFHELGLKVAGGSLVMDRAFFFPPLYVYFIGLVYRLLGESLVSLRMTQFVLGALGCVIIYHLAKRMFDRRVALASAFFAAVYGPFLYFEGHILGTSLVVFLTLGSVFLLALSAEGRLLRITAFLSGLLFACAVTGRPNLLLLVPLPALYLLSRSPGSGRRRAVTPLFWLLGASLPLGLTLSHNYLAEKTVLLISSHGGINFYIGNHEGASGAWKAPEGLSPSIRVINLEGPRSLAERERGRPLEVAEVSRYWYGRSLRFIAGNPLAWSRLMLRKLLLFWSTYEPPVNFNYYFHALHSPLLRFPATNFIAVIPLAFLGILVFFYRFWHLWLYYLFILTGWLSVALFFIGDRYRMFLMPFLIIFAAAGLFWLADRLRSREPAKLFFALIFLSILYASAIRFYTAQAAHNNFGTDCHNIALAHLLADNPGEAISWGQKTLDYNPRDADAHFNLGRAYVKKDLSQEALRHFSIVTEIEPGKAPAYDNIGAIFIVQNRIDRAIPYLQRAIENDPLSINPRMNLGIAYFNRGSYGEALREWQKVLEIDAGNEEAREKIRTARYLADLDSPPGTALPPEADSDEKGERDAE